MFFVEQNIYYFAEKLKTKSNKKTQIKKGPLLS